MKAKMIKALSDDRRLAFPSDREQCHVGKYLCVARTYRIKALRPCSRRALFVRKGQENSGRHCSSVRYVGLLVRLVPGDATCSA